MTQKGNRGKKVSHEAESSTPSAMGENKDQVTEESLFSLDDHFLKDNGQ